ncbi:MAG: hypothetical protein AAGF32_10015, partial [Pseudomonadota bacterium]
MTAAAGRLAMISALLGAVLVTVATMLAGGPGALSHRLLPSLALVQAPNPVLFAALPGDAPVPTLRGAAVAEASGVVVLRLETTHFGFQDLCSPAQAARRGQAHGHAHVYLGSKKVASARMPVIALAGLPAGEHTLLITLQA